MDIDSLKRSKDVANDVETCHVSANFLYLTCPNTIPEELSLILPCFVP
jgi:hypothetical protein